MAGGTKVGNLAVVISGDAGPLRASFAGAKKDARGFAADLTTGFGGGGMLAGLAGGGAGLAAMAGTTLAMTAATTAGNLLSSALSGVASVSLTAAKTAVTAAAEYERMAAAFEVFTGSAAAGKKLLDDIQQLAVATPFGSADLTKAGQMLLGMGVATESVLPALSRLGDLAAGDAVKLDRLTLAYGQVMAAGKFTGNELRQFTEAGVGVGDFAKAAGMSMGQFRTAMEAGAISADVVTKAVNDLTSAGGRFAGMNAKQSRTVMGQWNALTESLTISLQRIGTSIFGRLDIAGRLGRVADWFSGMEESAKPFLDVMGKAGGLIDYAWAGFKTLASTAKEFGVALLGEMPTMRQVQDFIKDAMYTGIVWAARFADVALWAFREVKKLAGSVLDFVKSIPGISWFAPGAARALEMVAGGDGMVTKAARDWLKNLDSAYDVMRKTATEAAKIPIEAGKMSAAMESAMAGVRQGMLDDPLTKFHREMANLPSAKQFGGGLTRQEMNFGIMKTLEPLMNQFGNVRPAELPQAMARYSVEAETAVVKAMQDNGSKDWQSRVEQTLRNAEMYQKGTWAKAAEIADAVRKLNLVPSELKR